MSTKYSLRRWMTISGMLADDGSKANSPEEAIKEAERLSGIFKSVITDEKREEIKAMAPGDKIVIRRPSLKFTLHIKRLR